MLRPQLPTAGASLKISLVAIGMTIALGAPAASQEQPLTAQQLQQCAQMIQTMRTRAPRLNAQARRLQEQRLALAEQRASLQASEQDNLDAWGRYNTGAAAFNKEMAKLRTVIGKINQVKKSYDQNCAGRPFRDADFQALPQALRDAMQAGLADIRVPYAGDPETESMRGDQPGATISR